MLPFPRQLTEAITSLLFYGLWSMFRQPVRQMKTMQFTSILKNVSFMMVYMSATSNHISVGHDHTIVHLRNVCLRKLMQVVFKKLKKTMEFIGALDWYQSLPYYIYFNILWNQECKQCLYIILIEWTTNNGICQIGRMSNLELSSSRPSRIMFTVV